MISEDSHPTIEKKKDQVKDIFGDFIEQVITVRGDVSQGTSSEFSSAFDVNMDSNLELVLAFWMGSLILWFVASTRSSTLVLRPWTLEFSSPGIQEIQA